MLTWFVLGTLSSALQAVSAHVDGYTVKDGINWGKSALAKDGKDSGYTKLNIVASGDELIKAHGMVWGVARSPAKAKAQDGTISLIRQAKALKRTLQKHEKEFRAEEYAGNAVLNSDENSGQYAELHVVGAAHPKDSEESLDTEHRHHHHHDKGHHHHHRDRDAVIGSDANRLKQEVKRDGGYNDLHVVDGYKYEIADGIEWGTSKTNTVHTHKRYGTKLAAVQGGSLTGDIGSGSSSAGGWKSDGCSREDLALCKHLALAGPECEKCVEAVGPKPLKCNEAQIDAMCYAIGDSTANIG